VPQMNAIAIPTGKIVVSTTLLEALENEEEREALLALAIAHIEMRHSLRMYQLQLSASQNSDAMKSLVKAAGSVAGIFPGGSLIGTLGSLPFSTSVGTQKFVSGFDEDFDSQADAMAALYFDLYHESRLFLYINDRSLLSDFSKSNGGKTISILVQDKNGTQKFNLLEKFTTEDLWGASLTFGASGKQNGHFIRDAKSIKLELTRPEKAGARREEPIVEQFMFVKGKLEY